MSKSNRKRAVRLLPFAIAAAAVIPSVMAEDVMRIHTSDGAVLEIPVAEIDSVTFSAAADNIIFVDEFNQEDRIPNPDYWELCPASTPAWTRHLSESYDQAYVEDGCLVLTAEKTDGSYLCGGIQLKADKAFTYGRVEVRALFQKMAQGTWPAIWMMPSEPTWSGWPQCGEIDIMEHLNYESGVWNVIHDNYTDALGHKCQANPWVNTSAWHTYRIDWTPEYIRFFIDDSQTLEYTNLHLPADQEANQKQWPFDAPFYLILNHALGDCAGTTGAWPGAVSDSTLPAIFLIDWVRVTRIE